MSGERQHYRIGKCLNDRRYRSNVPSYFRVAVRDAITWQLSSWVRFVVTHIAKYKLWQLLSAEKQTTNKRSRLTRFQYRSKAIRFPFRMALGSLRPLVSIQTRSWFLIARHNRAIGPTVFWFVRRLRDLPETHFGEQNTAWPIGMMRAQACMCIYETYRTEQVNRNNFPYPNKAKRANVDETTISMYSLFISWLSKLLTNYPVYRT